MGKNFKRSFLCNGESTTRFSTGDVPLELVALILTNLANIANVNIANADLLNRDVGVIAAEAADDKAALPPRRRRPGMAFGMGMAFKADVDPDVDGKDGGFK